MSSSGIFVAPHAVAVAAVSGPVLTEAAAAVLTVRAASSAIEGPARGAVEQTAGESSLLAWEPVVAAVVELNVRIRMLTARAARTGAAADIPPPLSLAGRSRAEAERWTAASTGLLTQARSAVRDSVVAEEARQVIARLTHRPEIIETLAVFQQTLRRRSALTGSESQATRIAGDIGTCLTVLDEDANEREHCEALSAAVSVAHGGVQEALVLLDRLQSWISDINAVVARRRLAAQWLAALEEPVVATAAAAEAPGAFRNTAAALRAVLDGDRDLSPNLRAEGAEAIAWAAAVTRRCFVSELLRDSLAELGYTASQEVDVRYSAGLAMGLSRPLWQGEHSAEIWVDQQGAVHGRVVRNQDLADDSAVERDRERRVGFDVDLRTLGHRLGADVVTEEGYFPLDSARERRP
ncbi:hypothetical protein [Catenulispora pinisilvae]|uniref:hypothetical protein n=1 Tax=Catenulispora pinisilvae TaxID=2705253 RepID=UPI0018918393|nr:hypothetical protein [Catenulispora pinisilvae]